MIRSVLSKVGSFSKVSATFNQDSISLHNIINAYKFNAFWLRDNCRCPQCFHKPSAQRLVDTFKIDPAIKVSSASVVDATTSVLLSDGHVVEYPTDWLVERGAARMTTNGNMVPKEYWPTPLRFGTLPHVNHDELMAGPTDQVNSDGFPIENDAHRELFRNLHVHGFSFVHKVPPTVEATRAMAMRLTGVLRDTHYGPFWDFTSDGAMSDLAYTNNAIPVHTDGSYFSEPPGLQMFHCIEFSGEGGLSSLVDGFAAIEDFREGRPEDFDYLTDNAVGWHTMDRKRNVHFRAIAPVIEVDLFGQLCLLRFNNEDRSPVDTLPEQFEEDFMVNYRELGLLLQRPERHLQYQLMPGSAVIFDNWRILHARQAFTGKRRIAGCYIPRDDYMSQARLHKLVM